MPRKGEVAEIKEWLQEEFPASVTDVKIDLQKKIDQLTQGSEEPLAQYYQRAISILRRTHGRDKPRDDEADALTGLEVAMLNCGVNAFIKGIHDDILRDVALSKDAATCGGLWKAYEIIQLSHRSIIIKRQLEQEMAKAKRLKELEFVYQQQGKPATVVLTEAAQTNNNHSHFLTDTSTESAATFPFTRSAAVPRQSRSNVTQPPRNGF
jgi:hypothetical protein